ncbi:ATP-binding cassette subfamily B protein [Gammaproteobacteria bacterium]
MTDTTQNKSIGTAVQCLAAVAQHHGITLSPEKLDHDYAFERREPTIEQFIRMAEENGLKARYQSTDWAGLLSLKGVFPIFAVLDNGNWVIVVGMRKEERGVRVALLDPLEVGTNLLLLDSTQFCTRWKGDAVFAKRIFSVTDEDQPFGLRWFLPEILRQRAAFRDIAVVAIFMMLLGLASPIFFQLIADKVLVHESYSTLYVLSVGILIAIFFESAFGFLRQYLVLGATNKIDMRLARRTFSHLLSLPIEFFESSSAGIIIKHVQQIEQIRHFLTGNLFMTMLELSGLLVFGPMLFFYSAKLAALVLLFATIMALVVAVLIKPFRARLEKLYEAEARRQALLVESIHGMRTVKALALEPVRRREWDNRSANSIANYFRVGQMSNIAVTLTHTLERLMGITILVLGAQEVFAHNLSLGTLIAFQMISGRVSGPLVQIVGLANEYQKIAVSVRMLGEVMNRPGEGRGRGVGLRPRLQGGITFEQVGFRYPGSTSMTLDDISLNLKAGMVVGVVGRSGSGKTTLTRLIQGMYSVNQGVIRMDGLDIREIELSHLRSSIGVVLQENFMFRGTVRDNISISKPNGTLNEIIAAAQAAGADEFIERLPQGYDTLLEENGANLSGGQKQRLSIARAILPAPRILILDEAASALDPDSEAIFIRNLARISVGKTVIMVSHRLSTLVKADAIIVFDRGRIMDVGTHSELLPRCEIYRHLWHQQTGMPDFHDK